MLRNSFDLVVLLFFVSAEGDVSTRCSSAAAAAAAFVVVASVGTFFLLENLRVIPNNVSRFLFLAPITTPSSSSDNDENEEFRPCFRCPVLLLLWNVDRSNPMARFRLLRERVCMWIDDSSLLVSSSELTRLGGNNASFERMCPVLLERLGILRWDLMS